MAKFTFGKTVDIHWNGYEIVGPALTEFSIPDQLYEEFEGDFRDIEPSLTWIDTNEFATLSSSVSASTLTATAPIAVTSTSTGKNISFSSGTALNGYLLASDGSGGSIWTPASTSSLTSVVGVSPISAVIAGGTVSVSLNANYQTAGSYQPAGIYVTAVSGTAPITASGTTSITVGIDQALLTAGAATTSEGIRTPVKNSSGSTITKGQVVYVTGADGTNALISLATASTEAGSSKTLGIAASTMTNNAFGYVTESGQLSNIDTSAATAGSSVWLGNTPGSYVFNSPPEKPANNVYLGVVTKANVSTGEILVKVQNGYELDELHDINVTGVSTALPLVYNSTSSSWIAQELSSVGIADNAIVASKIAAGAVGSAQIAASAVVLGDIAAGAVDSSALANNAVVAAKIAAGSVGTSAISSGAAASSTVLTANGAGGASFASLLSLSIIAATATTSVVNGSVIATEFTTTAAATGVCPAMALDETNKLLFQVTGRTTIKKINLTSNTQISTSTYTAMSASERIFDLSFGGSKLIAVTGPTAALGPSLYYIIDPSTMTIQNSGNIKEAANYLGPDMSIPMVRYDDQFGKFCIMISSTTVTTGSGTTETSDRLTFRIVDPSTYSTRAHTFTTTTRSLPAYYPSITARGTAATTYSIPVWSASGSRWIFGNSDTVRFFSDSNASTSFLTLTGSLQIAGNGRQICDIKIDPSSSSTYLYATTLNNRSYDRTYAFSMSNISLSYNTTGLTSAGSVYSYDAAATTVFGTTSMFDVRSISGETYVLVGVDILDGKLGSANGGTTYGRDPLLLVGTSLPFNGAYNFGNSGYIYSDGTSVHVLLSRADGGSSIPTHYRKVTLGNYVDWTVISATSGATPYVVGRDVAVTGVTNASKISGSGTRYAVSSNAASPPREISVVTNGAALTYRLSPDLTGTTSTASVTYWVVK